MSSAVAIYARMSTDKQSSDSPADQIARCREFAARRGLEIVEALVMVDSGRLELLDVPRLVAQLVGLERRTSRGGRESIDHARAGTTTWRTPPRARSCRCSGKRTGRSWSDFYPSPVNDAAGA